MNFIVCGGRVGVDDKTVWTVLTGIALSLPIPRDAVLWHGNALGTDRSAGMWAARVGLEVQPVAIDNALDGDMDDAPKRRNARMKALASPQVVICFPGGPGTRHMMGLALEDPSIRVLDVDLDRQGTFEVWDLSIRPAELLCRGTL